MSGIAELLTNTWGLLLVIFFFCGAIFFHELGHFLAAKWRGLKIERFSVGFGPRLFGWKGKDGIDYRVSLLPLGGYVALPQLADMRAIEGDSETPTNKLPPISYADKMYVAAAGPLFNVILAFFLATIVWFLGYPQSERIRSNTIGYVTPTLQLDAETTVVSPAAKAGLKPGDKIIAVDGEAVDSFADIQKLVVTGSGRDALGNPAVTLTIERNGKTSDIEVFPELQIINDRSGKDMRTIGIAPAYPLNIAAISEHSPAQKAGLQPGDIVVSADGKKALSTEQLNQIITPKAGSPISLGILRDGKNLEFTVTPEAVPQTKPLLEIAYEDQGRWQFLPEYTATADSKVSAFERDSIVILYRAPSKFGEALGQNLVSVNGKPVTSLKSLAEALNTGADAKNTFQFSNAKVALTGAFDANEIPPETRTLIGFIIDPGTYIAHPNPLEQVRDQIEMTFLFLGSLLSPTSDVGIDQMSGAVGISRVLHTFSIEDVRLAIWFSVLLNINLAILNLLPIPVLDGGHMAFATLSKLLRRPLPPNFIACAQGAFMIVLFGLMIYVTFNDSMDWIGDHEAKERYLREQSYYIPLEFHQNN